ncbi:hypothetical protein ACPROK_14780 [Glutamicibacter soli]|uniref:hypothetical protein n=1 Tax=Glutamicibacter soli TaxID=453836 RepID=UPI003C789BDE
MKKLLIASSTLALSLALVSCSGGSEPAPATTPSEAPAASAAPVESSASTSASKPADESGVKEYAFATGMTFGKVATSGKPSPELDAFLDAAGEDAGDAYEDDFTFWTVTIDNREGHAEAFPYEFRAYDKDGSEYIFKRTLDLVEAVQEQLPDAPDATEDSPEWKAYEKRFDLYEAAFESESVVANPGALKKFTVVTGDDLPEEFMRMSIDLGGLVGEAEVITLEDANSQGYPMDF